MLHILILIVTVLLVHTGKAVRLYLVLFGTGIGFRKHIKTYCIATPVSIIVPYKLGELFRIYCYGRSINNMVRSIITILFDRFMDTLGLLTVVFTVALLGKGEISTISIIFLFFTVLILLGYFIFPDLCAFWRRYLLRATATSRKIKTIKLIVSFDEVYHEIQEVAQGRGMILYFMSLICWAIEIGGLAVIVAIKGTENLGEEISGYLKAAIGTGSSVEMNQFAIVSIVILIIVFIIASLIDHVIGKGDQSCKL